MRLGQNSIQKLVCSLVSFVGRGSKRPPQRTPRAPRSAIVLALLGLTALGYAASAQPAAATHTIVIKAMKYQPDQLEVHAGDTVEWKNEDIVAHTVTARDKSFDSGKIAPGSSWKTTVTKAGTIAYSCVPHPNMKGRLVVK